jgi:hypothetical protein
VLVPEKVRYVQMLCLWWILRLVLVLGLKLRLQLNLILELSLQDSELRIGELSLLLCLQLLDVQLEGLDVELQELLGVYGIRLHGLLYHTTNIWVVYLDVKDCGYGWWQRVPNLYICLLSVILVVCIVGWVS